MSTDTQNGSHLTVIDTPEKLRAELDRIEGLIRAEQKRIAEQPPIGGTELVEAKPTHVEPPKPRRLRAALIGITVGAILTGTGYGIYEFIDNGSYDQVGSINCSVEICEG
jgi:hypothetical protein